MILKTRDRLLFTLLIMASFFGIIEAKTLKAIKIEGLKINAPEIVKKNLPLKEGEDFTGPDVQNCVKALYRQGDYKDIEVFIEDETDSSAVILFKLIENPLLESIEITGFKKLKQKELKDKLTIHKGFVISDAEIYENIQILKASYAEEGYLLADITCELIETKVPGNVIAKFKIKEGKKVRIKAVTFSGNTIFTERKLKRKLKTKEKKWFNAGEYKDGDYSAHKDTLLMFYYEKGFLDAAIVKDSVIFDDNNKDIFINLEISEGKRYYTGDFFFNGNTILKEEDLKSRIAMSRGRPFNKTKFEMTKALIGNAYREEGYLWAQVIEDSRFRGDTVDVTFDITEGRPAVVRKIDIVGNDKTREKVVRRELSIYPGQKYKQSRMERSVRDVMQLKYFDNVVPDLKPNEDGTIDLVYDVQESENIGQFSAGIQYSQQASIGGNFSISIPNFRGAGEQLDATVEFSKFRQVYSLGFSEPWIFDTPTWFSIRGFYEQRKREKADDKDELEVEYQSYGIEPGISRKLTWPDDYFKLYLRYRISNEYNNYNDDTTQVNNSDIKLQNTGWLSKVSATLVRNDTDVPNFPTRGTILSVSGQLAGLGGDYRFVKGVASYDWYFPVFWKVVLGMKSKFGLIGKLGDNGVIANSDLFAAGGVYYDGMIRGYNEGFIGRYNNDGTALLNFSAELRFPILDRQLYLAAFMDAGNIWNDIDEVDLNELYYGTGFGVRLMIPMLGLLGFDFGWGLKSPDQNHFEDTEFFDDGNNFQFHFLMNRGF